jgi:hypothetical protein
MLSVRDHYDTVLGVDRLPDLAAKLVRRDIHESGLCPGWRSHVVRRRAEGDCDGLS